MTMVNTANDLNFCSKFPFPLSTTCLELFHRHYPPIWKLTLVYTSKSTLTKNILLRKSICDIHQLFIREPWFWIPHCILIRSRIESIASVASIAAPTTIRDRHFHTRVWIKMSRISSSGLSVVIPIYNNKKIQLKDGQKSRIEYLI